MFTKKDYADISKLPNISKISLQYAFNYRLSRDSVFSNTPVLAVDPSYAKIHQISVLKGGRFISELDMKKQKAVIVLGEKSKEYLFPGQENPVGKYVKIGEKPFLVVGVMKHKSQLISHGPSDDFYNWVPASTYVLYMNPSTIGGVSLSYKDPKLLARLENNIRRIIAINHGADPQDSNIVNFHEFATRQAKINGFFSGMEIFLGVIGALTLMVAGVGIANVMFASVSHATHEIGIRMAIGARTSQILRHYILEALATTFIGGVVGLSFAGLLVYGLSKIPLKGQLIKVIGVPHPILSLSVVIIVISVLGVIGFLAGLFPALKASKIDPAEALSYE